MHGTNLLTDFGTHVRQLRKRRDLTQLEFARLAGLHRTYVAGLERGNRNPRLVTIHRVAQALKIWPGELFRRIR